jgi:hypothetical protein
MPLAAGPGNAIWRAMKSVPKSDERRAKAEQTHLEAMALMDAERQERVAKTAKLRDARLAALAAATPADAKPKKKPGRH